MQVNYMTELRRWSEWEGREKLSMFARHLWYAIMEAFNKRGDSSKWPDYLQINNAQLFKITGLSKASGRALRSAREELASCGRITYSSQSDSRKAGIYTIIPFEKATTCSQHVANGLLSADSTVTRCSQHNIHRHKQSDKLTTTTPLYPSIREPEKKAPWVQVVEYYLDVTGRLQNTPIDVSVAKNLCELSGDDVELICSTIDHIMNRGKRPNSLRYFEQPLIDAVALRDNPITEIKSKRSTSNRRASGKTKMFDERYYEKADAVSFLT